MKVAVFGCGTWGTALAQVAADNGHNVQILTNHIEQEQEINALHTNSKYFGHEIIINENVVATTSYEECLKSADYILLAVPTIAIRNVLEKIIPLVDEPKVFINASKGFDPETNKRISELINELLPSNLNKGVVSLIGPGHAEEVIIRQLTLITSTCRNLLIAEEVQKVFSNDYFRVYTNEDEVGAELGVAIKNSIAIASGILEGLGYGDNARAALVTRGLHEMVRFGTFFGGKMETFMGLAGLGDLMVTCNSHHSRNFRAGVQIGKDDSADFFLEHNKETTEGIRTTKVVHDIAKQNNIYMPIVDAMYQTLYEQKKPSELIVGLVTATLKNELD